MLTCVTCILVLFGCGKKSSPVEPIMTNTPTKTSTIADTGTVTASVTETQFISPTCTKTTTPSATETATKTTTNSPTATETPIQPDAYEPDNGIGSAGVLAYPQTGQVHSLHIYLDIDWMQFVLPSGCPVNVSAVAADAVMEVWIYDQYQAFFMLATSPSPGEPAIASFIATGASTWYVMVKSNSAPVGSYEVFLSCEVPTVTPTVTDTCICSHTVTETASSTTTITETWTISPTHTETPENTVTYTFSITQTSTSTPSCTRTPTFTATPTATNTGTPAAGVPDAYEDDDTYLQANSINAAAAETRVYYSDAQNDEDWVYFWATSGATYWIRTYNLGANADTFLYLYDSNGTTLITSNDDTVGLASEILWTNTGGNRNVYVRNRESSATWSGTGTRYVLQVSIQ